VSTAAETIGAYEQSTEPLYILKLKNKKINNVQ